MAAEDIGERLRDARLRQGLSLRGLAKALGVSPSLISQVETGKTQPSVSTLYAIVSLLGVSLDELLGVGPVAPRGAAQPSPVQRGADNPVLEMENGVRWERLAVGDGSNDALLVTYDPGASSSVEGRLMRHAGVEYAYILEGELTLQLDFDTFVLGPGDSLHFDSVRPHLYSNRGTSPARGIWFIVGRREQHRTLPDAPDAPEFDAAAPLTSAVDVLRAMDGLSR
ncbi:helix-turn-helix domain-containing protein [Agromyces mariniharenae]|uniref:Helix-turn-helix domain-containing protein n=1 Tax=Agromyces mariniharenae TaxID=2604423 RepID=A0A5S4VJV2_9MICO|nr:helix-turn-helix domain-containing protein [Agromyces mariniharenae]TYL54425.1 helix-turn-helix domain-containing protein [Agromyces mariniharenae]